MLSLTVSQLFDWLRQGQRLVSARYSAPTEVERCSNVKVEGKTAQELLVLLPSR